VLDSDIFQKAITIQLHFIMNVKSEADIAMEPNDLKLIITSKVMVKILDVYQYHECSTGRKPDYSRMFFKSLAKMLIYATAADTTSYSA
jgi:hypothetical protein